MQVTLIHNPDAGDAPPSGRDLERMLSEAGYQVRYQSTKRGWKKALQDPGELVVAAGGDGTVKKVARELSGRDVPMTVLPFGTANNIAKTLGIVGETAEIVAGWRRAVPGPFDLGVASAGAGEDRFVESAGGGAFAELIARGEEHVEAGRSIVGRETDRALYLLRRILEEAQADYWAVEVDGQDRSGRYVGVEVLNVRFAGPNIPLAPHADPGDGQLEVLLLGEDERRSLVDYLGERLEGGSARLAALPLHRGRHLRLAPPEGARFHLDDRLWPDDDEDRPGESGSVDIVVRTGALTILVPR